MRRYIALPCEKDSQIIQNNKELSTETHSNVSYTNKVCMKPWGYEYLVYESKKIGIWCLTLFQNHKTSMHCHFKKDTWIIVLQGCAKIELFQGTKMLYPMETLLIPKNTFHSLGTYSSHTTILEIEVFHETVTFSDKNDLLRVDDQYKRKPVGYESSVDVITEDLDKYGFFSLDTHESHILKNLTIQRKHIQSKNDIQHIKSSQLCFLLCGSIFHNNLYLKEGSLLPLESIEELHITEPFEVLCLHKIDWQEDKKIIHTFEHLQSIVSSLKLKNEKIILTSGCFDILHVGHIHTLKEAKSLGTKLIVCLSSDEQIKALKGSARPINNNQDRIDLFKIIHYVDYIFPYQEENIETEQTLGDIMKFVDPDFWVKGTDYTKEGILKKHPYLRNIALIDLVQEKSTTNIIQKILNT